MAYTDNIIAEFDFEEGMDGVTSYGTPVYSVQTIAGKERKVINVSGGQLRADNLIADYVANRQSTDKMTISFWFKHNGGDSWIISDMFGVGGGVQSYFRLTLDGRFDSTVRINVGLRAFNEWYLPSGGIHWNGIPMQGYPTSHGTWHHVSMVYDETMENGAGQFIGDITLYIDGVKTIGGLARGYGGLGNGNGLDELVNAPHFTIGGRSVNDQVFNGELSHFVVHGRALDEAEINELMNALPGAGGSSEALIDITYGGQLSGVRAFDHNDAVFCYITEEYGAPCVYFGTDLNDFASFEKKTIVDESSQPMVLEGKPMSLSMKSDDGSIYLGTRSGKLYHIAYDAGSTVVAKELFSGSGEMKMVRWDSYRSECLFEVGGVIRSVNLSDTVSVKHTLAAGSMVEDFKAAPSGVAIVFRKADFTFEVMFVEGTNWASPKASSQMIESVRAARDFEYNSDLDMWVAATVDGQTSVGDLLL